MAETDGLILDQLTDKHELLPFDPDDPDATQVVAVEHGSRTLEIIVPRLYDDTRIGEVVASAVASEVIFLLCRHDRPLDDFYGTLGLLVMAIPYRNGRYRAVIAHATHALEQSTDEREGLGLYPAIRPRTGTSRDRPARFDTLLEFYCARTFFPFVIETTSGERYSVPKPDSIAFSPGWDAMILWSDPGRFTEIDTADITQVTLDDPKAIEPTAPAEVAVEDRAGLRRLQGRIDGVEADVRRVHLDLRSEFQRGHLDHRSDRYRLKFWSGIQGCLLGCLLIFLFIGPGPTFYWTGTIDSQVKIHDQRLDQIEAKSAERHAAIGDRLDALKAAIRQANDRTSPPR